MEARRDARDPVRTTLGDLLYTGGAKSPVPESEWVAIVRAMAAGDQRALQALYERTHRIVFTLIVRITSDRQTAEELTLDVFHDAWRRAASYDPANGTVVGWLVNQARSRAIDRLRFEQRRKRVPPPGSAAMPASAERDPQQTLDVREQARGLRAALTALSPEERQAIEAAFFAELTYVEVAGRLGQPVGTVKTRIRAALGKLRQALGGR